MPHGITPRMYPGLRPGYAASRPLVFGLSSSAPLARDESDPPPFQNHYKYTDSLKE